MLEFWNIRFSVVGNLVIVIIIRIIIIIIIYIGIAVVFVCVPGTSAMLRA